MPYAIVNYNSAPTVGTRSTSPTSSCVTGAGRPWLNSLTPQLRATISDPEGSTVKAEFEWYSLGGTRIGGVTTGTAASATTLSTTVPSGTLTDGGGLKWRVRASDAAIWSPWSGFCEFSVDTTKPGAPLVVSTDYPNDTTWHGAFNQPGQFTFTPAASNGAGGSNDLASFVYQMDNQSTPTTTTTTGSLTVSINPAEDGARTLTVQAKDTAGNLSDPITYVFHVGRAGLSMPAQGATVVRRMKLAIEGDASYTRVRFAYRRGPGAVEQDIPLPNLTTATGAPVAAYPVSLSSLGDNAIWNAVDTLGSTGGVIQVKAVLYPTGAGDAYQTQWITVNVDLDGDGAASDDVGPGQVNLLTGDYNLSATDAEEFDLSVDRSASSRDPNGGWIPQGERLTANQQQISTDTTGFTNTAGGVTRSTIARVTTRGQGGTTDSLDVGPTGPNNDTFASIEGDHSGGLRLGMQAGRRYRITGWVYVPAATGLTGEMANRGLRLVTFVRVGTTYTEAASAEPTYVDGWQQLTVDMVLPVGANESFVRLYNGMPSGSGKKVYWDNLSVRELVAPFGPQWSGGPTDAVAGNDYTSLELPTPDVVRVNTTDGGYLTFGKSATGSFFPEPGAEDLTLTAVSATVYRLGDLAGTVVEFTKQSGSAAYLVTSTWTTQTSSTTRYIYDITDNRTTVKKVINPTEPGIGDCTTSTPARGCEVLEYVYATVTTATPTSLGAVKDQVQQIRVWSWDPTANNGAGAQTPVVVTEYRYDTNGRLREVWDPRMSPSLKTSYDYDTIGHVTALTPAGELPWMFDYGTIPADTSNAGRLHRVRRAALVQGSTSTTDGETTTRVVYQVPLTSGAGGPYDMDYPAVSTWAQHDLPTDATAIFGPQDDPTVTQANTSIPGPGGFQHATVHYLNASAQEVNTATPGGNIDTQEYDRYGNVVRTLEATSRAMALGTLPNADAYLSDLGLLGTDTAGRAQALSTVNSYSSDGIDLLHTVGPTLTTVLQNDVVDPDESGPIEAITAGSTVIARLRTVNKYDEGKPDGAAYHLLTTQTQGAHMDGYPDADTRTTTTGYAAEHGGVSGWTLKKPTKVITDVGGENLTTYTVHDAAGRVTATLGVDSTGADARTLQTIYYTPGTNSLDIGCGNRPEWAGQVCLTHAAGTVTGHDPTRMTTNLPIRRVTGYSRHGDETTVTETAGGKTRTTALVYDSATRITSTTITADDGTAIPTVTTTYDPTNGQVTSTSTTTATISREYDRLGRQVTYTDADGAATVTEYDRYGRQTKISDPTGHSTYAYDRAAEPRGMLTSVTDSIAGIFAATYAPDGQLIGLKYPGGLTRTDRLDANLQPVERVYARDSDGVAVYSESVTENSAGQWITHEYTGGSKTHTYDQLGRLTQARHDSATTGCITRTYAHDNRTNRTNRSTFQPAADGACDLTTADTENTHDYDTADRLTDPGYTYDAFGRTTHLPSGLAISYYTNDLAQGQQIGGTRQTWTLDPALRFRASSTQTQVDGAWTDTSLKTNHYGDDSDEARWIMEDVQGGITRNITGPDTDLVATTSATGDIRLHLTNLHGDVTATIDTALSEPELLDYDEFGVPMQGQADQRYGWLGGKQRSGEAMTDVMLMGVRLYSPELGRFLQVDPVYGGSCNAYEYTCADPVNKEDLNGKWIGLIARGIGAACKVGRWCVRSAKYIGRQVGRAASWGARTWWNTTQSSWSRLYGKNSHLFGSAKAGRKGWLNRGPVRVGWTWKASEKKYRFGLHTGYPKYKQTNSFHRRFPRIHWDWF